MGGNGFNTQVNDGKENEREESSSRFCEFLFSFNNPIPFGYQITIGIPLFFSSPLSLCFKFCCFSSILLSVKTFLHASFVVDAAVVGST